MWCEQCQAEVAAQASQDHQRLQCATCSRELPISGVSPGSPATPVRDPRELLARWAQQDLTDPFGPPISRPGDTTTNITPAATLLSENIHAGDQLSPAAIRAETPIRTEQQCRTEQQWRRFDPAGPAPATNSAAVQMVPHSADERPQHVSAPSRQPLSAAPPSAQSPTGHPGQWVWHDQHASRPPVPHFSPAPETQPAPSGNWATLAGQILAYAGVGTLTIGATLVLMGYFGDTPSYAPTGWLVTTLGQMLLFLGVVTLVSGGMDQTTQEVARRIDQLGEQIVRLEQAAHSRPQPPHFAQPPASGLQTPAGYANGMLAESSQTYAPRGPE